MWYCVKHADSEVRLPPFKFQLCISRADMPGVSMACQFYFLTFMLISNGNNSIYFRGVNEL